MKRAIVVTMLLSTASLALGKKVDFEFVQQGKEHVITSVT